MKDQSPSWEQGSREVSGKAGGMGFLSTVRTLRKENGFQTEEKKVSPSLHVLSDQGCDIKGPTKCVVEQIRQNKGKNADQGNWERRVDRVGNRRVRVKELWKNH